MGKIERSNAHFGNLEVVEDIFIEGGIKGYSSWEIYSRFDTGILANADNFLTVGDDGKAMWFYDPTTVFYAYDRDTGLVATYIDRFIFPIYFPVTILGRYAMAVAATQDWIALHRAEIEVWRSDFVTDRGPYTLNAPPLSGFWTCSISPRGEWILVELVEDITLNALLFFYRGVRA